MEGTSKDGTSKLERVEAREAALWLMIRRPEARRKPKLVLHSYRGWRLLAEWNDMRGCSNKFDLGLETSQSLMAARKGLEIVGQLQARDWSLVARCNAFVDRVSRKHSGFLRGTVIFIETNLMQP